MNEGYFDSDAWRLARIYSEENFARDQIPVGLKSQLWRFKK